MLKSTTSSNLRSTWEIARVDYVISIQERMDRLIYAKTATERDIHFTWIHCAALREEFAESLNWHKDSLSRGHLSASEYYQTVCNESVMSRYFGRVIRRFDREGEAVFLGEAKKDRIQIVDLQNALWCLFVHTSDQTFFDAMKKLDVYRNNPSYQSESMWQTWIEHVDKLITTRGLSRLAAAQQVTAEFNLPRDELCDEVGEYLDFDRAAERLRKLHERRAD